MRSIVGTITIEAEFTFSIALTPITVFPAPVGNTTHPLFAALAQFSSAFF